MKETMRILQEFETLTGLEPKQPQDADRDYIATVTRINKALRGKEVKKAKEWSEERETR